MKKRFLALALCLVMAVSLLPITAAAVGDYGTSVDNMCVTGSGFEETADGYVLKVNTWLVNNFDCYTDGEEVGVSSQVLCQDEAATVPVTGDLVDGGTYYLKCQLLIHEHDLFVVNNLNATNCFLEIPGYSSAYVGSNLYEIRYTPCIDVIFQVTKLHEHQWQYTTTGKNSLTATCQNAGCNIGTVGVTLTADSVTLPNSPFKANLTFEGNFKEVFHCSEIEYKYEDPATGWNYVDPDTFTPKPGNYQAGVLISGLPGNGGAAARAVGDEDGADQGGSVYLFVKYTAVDPKVTAQTGDNRPIELMLVSAAVFSALAAAAFILDSKRKYSR